MFLRNALFFASTLFAFNALADVEFTTPAAGGSVSGMTLQIAWQDSGTSPPLASLQSYQLFLCAGGNAASSFIQLSTLVTNGDFTDGNSVSVTITPGLGGTDKNAYFLKMISATTGGVVINYSDRFTLSGMTGTWPAAVQAGLKTVTGTAGPATQNQVAQVAAGSAPAAGAAQFTVPFADQSGIIMYAPMAQIPGTKITAKNPSRQFATSSWTPYSTYAAPPVATQTITEPQTYAPSKVEATQSAAAMPSDSDMQKFLARWKD